MYNIVTIIATFVLIYQWLCINNVALYIIRFRLSFATSLWIYRASYSKYSFIGLVWIVEKLPAVPLQAYFLNLVKIMSGNFSHWQ
jgi:hypothetical protein